MPIELRRPVEGVRRTGLTTRFPVYTTLALDPAVSSKNTADASGITVVCNDPNSTWWIFEADDLRAQPLDVCDRIVRHALTYRPQAISIEAVAAQILYRDLLLPRLQAAGVFAPIVEYRDTTRVSKHARISALQPLYKQGKIKVRAGLTRLIYELEHYAGPDSLDHEDLLDSVAQHIPISRPASLMEVSDVTYTPEVPPSKRGERRYSLEDRGDGCWTGY